MPDAIDPTRRSESGPSPEPDDDGLPDLDDASDRRVRELLAQSRHDAPLPPVVAARLDEVLAGLVSEPATGAGPAAPIDLDSRRRRKHWTTGLVAAAAAVVVGVSVPTLLDANGGGDSQSASTAAPDRTSTDEDFAGSAAESDKAPGGRDGSGDDQRQSADSPTEKAPQEFAEGSTPAAGPVLEVDPDRFRDDVLDVRDAPSYDSVTRLAPCGPGPVGAAAEQVARLVVVRYGDQRGYLVFLDPQSATQRVDLYLCPSGDLERTVRVPVR